MKRGRQCKLSGLTVIGQSVSSKPPPRVVQTCGGLRSKLIRPPVSIWGLGDLGFCQSIVPRWRSSRCRIRCRRIDGIDGKGELTVQGFMACTPIDGEMRCITRSWQYMGIGPTRRRCKYHSANGSELPVSEVPLQKKSAGSVPSRSRRERGSKHARVGSRCRGGAKGYVPVSESGCQDMVTIGRGDRCEGWM